MDKTISLYIKKRIIIILELMTLIITIMVIAFGLVNDFTKTRTHAQLIAQMLATIASTTQGIEQISEQITYLLNNDKALESIVFYSIDHPINDDEEYNGHLWLEALTVKTASVHYPVLSRQFASDNPMINRQALTNKTLIGYISITLDMQKFRRDWFAQNKWLIFLLILINILSIWFVFKVIKRPIKQINELARVSHEIIKNTELQQLPVLSKDMEYIETLYIKQGFLALFQRLNKIQASYQSLKEYEEQLKSKDQSLDIQRSSFQGMITHELKTSLNAIFGGLQLLDNQYLSHEQQDALAIIRKGSQQLDFSLEQIIQLNKIEKGQLGINLMEFQPLQLLSDLIAEFEPLAKEKNLEIISHISHVDYMLEGDMHKIRMILELLLDNAIKFTKEGSITIESHLTHFNQSSRWSINIIDTGIGIPHQHLEDIFTPFFQIDPSINREYEGIGIGLSLAKQMCQILGATLDVKSDVQVGSCFSLTLQLKNWQHTKNRNLLHGVRVINYHHSSILSIKEAVQTLEEFGASITNHQHCQSVIDDLKNKHFDILVIYQDTSPKLAKNLATNIRRHESSHRLLIVYFYHPEKSSLLDMADLHASGIDFCHEDNLSMDEKAYLIKNWLMI